MPHHRPLILGPALAVLWLVLLSCDGLTDASPDTTFLKFESDPGDWVGQGQTLELDQSNATFEVSVQGTPPGQEIHIAVTNATNRWFLDLAAPSGRVLAEGGYPDAERWPFQQESLPGLAFSGNGRGCNTVVGSFRVYAAALNPDTTVSRLHATFRQYCGGATPGLSGEISIVDAGTG